MARRGAHVSGTSSGPRRGGYRRLPHRGRGGAERIAAPSPRLRVFARAENQGLRSTLQVPVTGVPDGAPWMVKVPSMRFPRTVPAKVVWTGQLQSGSV